MVNESDRERLGDGSIEREGRKLDQGVIRFSTCYTALPWPAAIDARNLECRRGWRVAKNLDTSWGLLVAAASGAIPLQLFVNSCSNRRAETWPQYSTVASVALLVPGSL